jgi:hypothetical protein
MPCCPYVTRLFAVLAVVAAASNTAPFTAWAADGDLPVLLEETFEQGADKWKPTDPNAWKLTDDAAKGKVFSQFQQSKFKPPHRSPLNIAWLDGVKVGDFVLELDLLSTAREYDHRSLCLAFGYQDPAHYYYVHLGKKTDDHANQIFIVNAADRKKISTKTTAGTPWDDKWHHVKIERKVADGTIRIFFDDMQTPIMEATDKNFAWGQIGIGSFDDTGSFDKVVLRGVKVEPPK